MRWVVWLLAMTGAAMASEPTPNELRAAESDCLIRGSEALPKAPGAQVLAARSTRVGPEVRPPRPGALVFWLEYDIAAVGRRITYATTCIYEWSKPPYIAPVDIKVPNP